MFEWFLCIVDEMSSSGTSDSSDYSSSEDDAPPPPPSQSRPPPTRPPPIMLCWCKKCVGMVKQKSYVCDEHIERFGRHERLTPGASSSHMVCYPNQMGFFLSLNVLCGQLGNCVCLLKGNNSKLLVFCGLWGLFVL
jgi:hypothetical protein